MLKFQCLVLFLLSCTVQTGQSQPNPKLQKQLDQQISNSVQHVVAWRRHLHQYAELSNREFNTSKYISDELKKMGVEVQTPIAKTGVVGILKSSKPGPVVGLRADMDGLPITEAAKVPFASTQKAIYNEQETGVMHACGHDAHMAVLLGVAEILTKYRNEIPGTIKFIFQPAEEGAPFGEERGAKLMVKEGVLTNPKVDVIFGLHVNANLPVGSITFRPGYAAAANDNFYLRIKGRQSHGASPWVSIDPIVVAAQTVLGIQSIISRQTDLTKGVAIITVGTIRSGIRENIISDEAILTGTIRTLDTLVRNEIHNRLRTTVLNIAESAGATASLEIVQEEPAMYNDLVLTERMAPSLKKALGPSGTISHAMPETGAEDFAYFQKSVPGLYFTFGGKPADLERYGDHHTPEFYIDESGFLTGLKAMTNLAVDYLFLVDKKK